MRPKHPVYLVAALLTFPAGVVLAAPDPVSEFLSAHGMRDLLEVRLADNIDRARNDEERQAAIGELASFYLQSLRTLDPSLPERERLIAKAWDLSSAYEFDELIELRLELLIERYLPIERIVELHTLLLDDPEDTARAKKDLAEIESRLERVESASSKQLALLERQSRSSRAGDADKIADRLAVARRNLSLTRYYIGWVGYSKAALDDRSVRREAIEAFGWLFGAKGQVPTMDDLDHASLEYEHVARAAIGTAMCKAHNGDTITARTWLKRIESDHSVERAIKDQALVRRLQIEANAGEWMEVQEIIRQLHTDRSEPLQTPEARFVAIKVLENRDRTNEPNAAEERVVRSALGDLIKRGEIGHILDLQRRYGSLPLLSDRFISQYASALQTLSEAESEATGGHFLTAASLFAGAIKSKDADRFPKELLDCKLKLAYCEIRSDRPAEALKVLDPILAQGIQEPGLEQARWLRLIALDLAIEGGSRKLDSSRNEASIEYILAYPQSANAAKLILRHGLDSGIDQASAINALLALPEDDPSVLPARYMLVQLFYKQYRDSKRTDLAAAASAFEQAEWIWAHSPDSPSDLADATARLNVIRKTLDIAMDDIEPRRGLITRAILRGLLLVDSEPSLQAFKDEILLRRIQFLLQSDKNMARAENELTQMTDLSGIYAQSATQLIFAAALTQWQTQPSNPTNAQRIVRIGSAVLEFLLPPAPEPIDANLSAILSSIAQAAWSLAGEHSDPEHERLAYRLSKIVLARGVPNEPLLRLTAELAQRSGDPEIALDAWLQLLGQYTHDEVQWYEARYESFRLLLSIDRDRAQRAIEQFRVLYPNPGPEPWGSKIQSLIGSLPSGDG